MTEKAGKLIKQNIDFLSDRWIAATANNYFLREDLKKNGSKEVEQIINQILEALVLILDDEKNIRLFETRGAIYRKAKHLSELRRSQGYELEQVLQEYLTLRHELWLMLRENFQNDEVNVFEIEKRVNYCLMNILKATIESFHNRQTKDLREQAITDSLTGLFNRRQFDKIILHEIYRADRYKRKLSLALIDIDHFKLFNDLYGHPAGDHALEKVADIIRQFLRVSDAGARYGGEEFALVLPETNHDQANRVCSRIRRSVERSQFEVCSKPACLTISVGIACYPDDAKDGKKLLDMTDKALYQAKRFGRNRVISAANAADEPKTKWFRLGKKQENANKEE